MFRIIFKKNYMKNIKICFNLLIYFYEINAIEFKYIIIFICLLQIKIIVYFFKVRKQKIVNIIFYL